MHSQGEVANGLDPGLHRAPLPVSLWAYGTDAIFRIADVNEAGCRFSGYTREKMLGATAAELGGNAARSKRDMLRAMRGETVTRELPRVMPDGDVRDIQVVYVARAENEVLAFVIDVTPQRAAEERLRIAETRYQSLVASANEGVWLVDISGKTLFANAKVGRMLSRPLSDIAERKLIDFVDEQDRAIVAAALDCPLDTPTAFEARFRDGDGADLLCLLSVSPVPGAGESPDTLCLLADLTAVQHERQLRHATEERFRWMIETASEGIWTGDREGNTTFLNAAGAQILGVDRWEILGRPSTDFDIEEEAANAVRAELRRTGGPIRRGFRITRPDGKQIDVVSNLSTLRNDEGKVVGSLAMFSDVTQSKVEHRELLESRERFAQVFEEAPVGMAFLGAGHLVRGRFLGANRAFHDLLGYADGELLELDMLSVTHPDDAERERPLAKELFENERSDYELDKRFVRADGSLVWARFRAHVLRDDRGAPLYGLGLAVDITAEKAAAGAMSDAAARANALLDSTPDAVVELGADGTIREMNGAALRMFGFEQAQIAGGSLVEVLVPERLRARVTEALAGWLQANEVEPSETTMMRADGSEFPAQLRIAPVVTDGPTRLMLYVRNLALLDRAETGRRHAEERFERLFRDGPVASVVVDLSGRLTDVNQAFCRLAGRDAPSLVGHDASDVMADAGDPHEAPWRSGVERPGPLSSARRVQRPDGKSVPVQLTASLVRDAAGTPSHWLCQCMPKLLAGVESVPEGEELSYRERQVLGLLAGGLDGPAIADRLSLSPETIRSYAQTAREKLGAKTRTEAVALALVRGEISL